MPSKVTHLCALSLSLATTGIAFFSKSGHPKLEYRIKSSCVDEEMAYEFLAKATSKGFGSPEVAT